MQYAIIQNGTVINIALADSPLDQSWVDVTNISCGIGYTTADNITFTAPVPPPVPAPSKVITHLQYMNLFTEAELVAIYTAAQTSVAVQIWLDKFRLTPSVDLNDPQTAAGLAAMVAAGLLATGRDNTILSNTAPT